MSRIDSLNEPSRFRLPGKKTAERRKAGGAAPFGDLVEAAREEGMLSDDASRGRGQRRSLEELLDGIFTSGEALKSGPTVDRIKDYRTNVREFLDYVVHKVLALEETTSGIGVLKRKRFTLVRVIDGKLEDLALAVLRSQSEQLDILAKVDEINGFLVDLVR